AFLNKARVTVFDRRAVRRWLRKNTNDEAGQSHAGTTEIAKGTGFSEERARHACMSDKRIYRAHGEIDLWSVWRQDPQSVYDKRGLLIV
ncbi:MAG: hypothetical protein Q7O66_09115, partial [Dehalococcoidia bacterium]|nr:hypothetical protein [Dehalococcoidia bacterium]